MELLPGWKIRCAPPPTQSPSLYMDTESAKPVAKAAAGRSDASTKPSTAAAPTIATRRMPPPPRTRARARSLASAAQYPPVNDLQPAERAETGRASGDRRVLRGLDVPRSA